MSEGVQDALRKRATETTDFAGFSTDAMRMTVPVHPYADNLLIKHRRIGTGVRQRTTPGRPRDDDFTQEWVCHMQQPKM